MDPGALDALQADPPSVSSSGKDSSSPVHRPAAPRKATHPAPVAPASHGVGDVSKLPSSTAHPAVPVAAGTPGKPEIPPALNVPLRPTTLPVLPVPNPDGGQASDLTNGVRVVFKNGDAQLSAPAIARLQALGQHEAAASGGQITIMAFALGHPEDPSTPRRLALSRALAIRAVLLHENLPSSRVLVQAMGPQGDSSLPADRADVTVAAPR